ncbi:MAG: YqgE/AlgH family protein [Paludibacteraceae bacterium]|nr:YqgE/AlgH family protein [Paludibacteraceae bacterium]
MEYNEDIFKIEFNNIQPTKGCVLISEPFLQDAYFQRSVILLVDHTDKGSMGLVLNKELEVDLCDLVEGFDVKYKTPIFLGGPVAVETLFYIHTFQFIPNSYPITDSLYLNGDFDLLKDYINQGGETDGKIKFFFGYSGWDKEQLMNEIKENSWMVSSISDTDILNNHTMEVWENTLSGLGDKYKQWTKFPKDPSLN